MTTTLAEEVERIESEIREECCRYFNFYTTMRWHQVRTNSGHNCFRFDHKSIYRRIKRLREQLADVIESGNEAY